MLHSIVHRFKESAAQREIHALSFLAESARDSSGKSRFQQMLQGGLQTDPCFKRHLRWLRAGSKRQGKQGGLAKPDEA